MTDEPAPGPDFCAYHYVSEPVTETTFRVCGECWHAFQTEDELRAAMLSEWGDTRHHSEVGSCPLCGHDW